MTSMNSTSFVPAGVLNRLGSLTAAEADALPFGVVKLTADGTILLYNRYNGDHFADFGGRNVVGRNYFTEVAPCSNNFLFSGRFRRGMEMGSLDFRFEYVFTYKIEPTRVRVHLYYDATSETGWVFVVKL